MSIRLRICGLCRADKGQLYIHVDLRWSVVDGGFFSSFLSEDLRCDGASPLSFTFMPARLSAVSAVGLVSFPSNFCGDFCCDSMSLHFADCFVEFFHASVALCVLAAEVFVRICVCIALLSV